MSLHLLDSRLSGFVQVSITDTTYCVLVKRNESAPSLLASASNVVSLAAWRREIGISDTTAWRYCKAGWLHPLNIAGRPYLTRTDIADFEAKAAAGQFAKEPRGAAAAKSTNCAPRKVE